MTKNNQFKWLHMLCERMAFQKCSQFKVKQALYKYGEGNIFDHSWQQDIQYHPQSQT